jgi:hypothetical protein
MNRRLCSRALVGALSLSLISSPVLGDPPHGKGKGKNRHVDEAPVATVPIAASASTGVGPVRINVSFDQARRYAMDTGAHGYQPLPPGIRKNLARGKPLPPGIAKKYAPAPMVSRLPVHPGHEWRVVGTDLVLVAVATAVVVDILLDVFS